MRKILYIMKRQLLLLVVLIACSTMANALVINERGELDTLNAYLTMRDKIDVCKHERIDSLYQEAAISVNPYEVYKSLYLEYRCYNYDTALIYVENMEREALPEQMPEVDLCRAFVYLSGGLFKEASDILDGWEERYSAELTRDLMLRYCVLYARLLWDMADQAGGMIGERYNAEGLSMNRRVQTYLTERDTAYYWYALAVMDLREGNYPRSIARCKVSLASTQPSVHDQAITASTLAYLYRITGDQQAALHYYIEAAVCDIRSSTYETVALRNVAELLFEAGETDLSDRYIRIAMQDALRYHARHRQVDVAQSLPIIEEKMLGRIRRQQFVTLSLLVVVAVLLLIGIVGIVVLVRQNKAIASAREAISHMNTSLTEANKLKEQLLGTLLTSRTKYINAVKQYQQDVKQYAANRQWSALLSVPKAADARLQRAVLDRQIDTIFLSICPTFVEDFNALMRPEEQFTLKKDELLNAQLRIFALIRLGVTHNEVIAEILDYSINTVYSYKTRVLAASKLKSEEFYSALMQIPSFGNAPK